MSDEKTPPAGDAPPPRPPTEPTRPSTQPTPRPPTKVPASPWTGTPPSRGEEPPEVEVDDILRQRSKRIRRLGSGGQGEVWLVEHLGQLEAHKFLVEAHGAEAAVFREALHTRKVRHPNIVQVYGTEEVGGRHVLRMEYVGGRDLATLVDTEGVLPVERLVPIAAQVADALQATHERGILHHDLKPSNLILREDGKTVVVTDFGISEALRLHEGELRGGRGGTPHFMAPELFEKDGHGSPRSDIWSLGVTLYYCLSLTYPFPFGAKDHAEAVREEPHDLSRTHPYVGHDFWLVLRRMLSVDPEGGYASMQEVKADLEIYAHSVRCPACGNVFRFDSVSQACPDPACQSPRLPPYKRGLLARRRGETALACCEYEGALTDLEAAASALDDAEVPGEAAEVRARLDAIREHGSTLERLVGEVSGLLERERYIDCVQSLQQARSLFSRSPSIVDLRRQVHERLRTLYLETESRVREALTRQDFKAAIATLTRIDHVMGDRYARRELTAALGEEPKAFRELYAEVEQKELTFNRYVAKARESILAFDFEKALRVYTVLETEFPSEANVEMLARLRQAPSTYAYAIKYPEEGLRKVIADPSLLADAKKIRINKVNRACRKLLNDFSVEDFPTFERIRILKDLTSEAIDAAQTYVQDRLIEAKQAEEEQNVFEELQVLKSVDALVTRSDLFDVATKQHVMRRLRSLEESVSRAEAHYKDGLAALEAREYVKAQVAFREVTALIPDGYKDIEKLRTRVEEMRGRLGVMRQEVAYELGEIERRQFTLESAMKALTRGEELYTLSGDTERETLLGRIARAATVLFDSQREHLATSGEGTPEASFGFLSTTFVPLVRLLPEERWTAMLAGTSELSRAMCGLLSDAYVGQGSASRSLEAEVERAQAFCSLLEPVREVLRLLVPPLGSTHPSQAASSAVARAFESARRAQQEIHLMAAVAGLKELAQFSPDETARAVHERVEALLSWGRRARFETSMLRVKRIALLVAPYVAALVVGWLLGLWRGASTADSLTKDRMDRLTQALGFTDPAQREEIYRLLQVEGEAYPTRVIFLSDWATLRDMLERKDSVPAAAWVGEVFAAGREGILADSALLRDEFRGNISDALVEGLRALFRNAATILARSPGDSVGLRALVLLRIDALRGAIQNAELPQQKRELDGLRTDLDGLFVEFSGIRAAVDARTLTEEKVSQLRQRIDGIAQAGRALKTAGPDLRLWLACELRGALVEELARRARHAAELVETADSYHPASEMLLTALTSLRDYGLDPLVVPATAGDDIDAACRTAAIRAARTVLGGGG